MKRTEWVLKRTFFALVTIFVAITINFILFRMMPGNYADQIRSPHMTAAAKKALLHEFGLDKSMWQQYLLYLRNLTHLNMGISVVNYQRVWPQMMTMFASTTIGCLNPNSWIDCATASTASSLSLGLFS
jgi:ABC-type dipeptide/oligopeptide/nickel transport system permease component